MDYKLKLAWCAGYLEENGTWWIMENGELALSLRSKRSNGALERFCETLDLKPEKIRRRHVIRLRLDRMLLKTTLELVWPYLTADTRTFIRREFAKAKL